MNNFFIVFAHPPLGPPTIYRGNDGTVVVYDTSPEAEAAAAELTASNKQPSASFIVTEFQPSD